MKRILLFLVIALALVVALPIAAGSVDTGPPVWTVASNSVSDLFAVNRTEPAAVVAEPVLSSSAPTLSIESAQPYDGITLAGLMCGVALCILFELAYAGKHLKIRVSRESSYG
jgi:hypothetical protein